MKKFPAKAADALDLMIEFVTLGEYGLEHPDSPGSPDPDRVRAAAPCAPARIRTRPSIKTRRPGRTRPHTPPAKETRPARSRRGTCHADRQSGPATNLPEALLPPRIQLDLNP